MLVVLALAVFGANCPATQPPDPSFVPPAAFAGVPLRDAFWYGTPELWTQLPNAGAWDGLPRNDAGRRQKVFYWRPGYDGRVEQRPALVVTLRRLDAAAPPVEIRNATNAYFDGMWSMLVGVDFPTPGCWDVTARYRDAALTFVVDVR
jgi:hypothetical protein